MEVIYRAFDGKEFTGTDAYEKCQTYKKIISNYPLAYNGSGKETTSSADSIFVIINNAIELQSFYKICEIEGSSFAGVDSVGHWLWIAHEGKYIDIRIAFKSIKGYFQDNCQTCSK